MNVAFSFFSGLMQISSRGLAACAHAVALLARVSAHSRQGTCLGAQIGRSGNAKFAGSDTAVFKFFAILHEHARHGDSRSECHPTLRSYDHRP